MRNWTQKLIIKNNSLMKLLLHGLRECLLILPHIEREYLTPENRWKCNDLVTIKKTTKKNAVQQLRSRVAQMRTRLEGLEKLLEKNSKKQIGGIMRAARRTRNLYIFFLSCCSIVTQLSIFRLGSSSCELRAKKVPL